MTVQRKVGVQVTAKKTLKQVSGSEAFPTGGVQFPHPPFFGLILLDPIFFKKSLKYPRSQHVKVFRSRILF